MNLNILRNVQQPKFLMENVLLHFNILINIRIRAFKSMQLSHKKLKEISTKKSYGIDFAHGIYKSIDKHTHKKITQF